MTKAEVLDAICDRSKTSCDGWVPAYTFHILFPSVEVDEIVPILRELVSDGSLEYIDEEDKFLSFRPKNHGSTISGPTSG